MKHLGKNLLYLRKSAGLQQAQMPNEIGISRATWSNYENDISEPNIETLIEIANYFGIGLTELITDDLQAKGNLIEKKDEGQNSNLSRNRSGNPIEKKTHDQQLATEAGLCADKIAFKEQLIASQKETIESLKQANSALSSLTEAQKATIATLQAHITELKQKTGLV